jgi:hypothetical protein
MIPKPAPGSFRPKAGRGLLLKGKKAMTIGWFPQTDVEHAMQHEIDTLRAENERLSKLVYGERAKLADENERLREALSRVVMDHEEVERLKALLDAYRSGVVE